MQESQVLLFIVTSVFLIITPGQDMILVMSRSISRGWKAGVITAAGVSTGLLGHTLIAALGLGAVLTASRLLFNIMKYIGAAYLLYLGIKMLISRTADLDLHEGAVSSLRKMFFQGAFSNISNPKIVIFYLAYLPQFVPAHNKNGTLLLLMLGTSFALLTFLVKGPIGCVAGMLSSWLRSHPRVIVWINRISGGVLVGLGLKLALERGK